MRTTSAFSLSMSIGNIKAIPFVRSSEKAMAPHSSTLAWKIPWTEEPGGLQSMGLRRVGHDWATSLWLFTCMHWRRKWQPTPVFLPGESQGRGSLVGCRLWVCTESDMTEAMQQQQQSPITFFFFLIFYFIFFLFKVRTSARHLVAMFPLKGLYVKQIISLSLEHPVEKGPD